MSVVPDRLAPVLDRIVRQRVNGCADTSVDLRSRCVEPMCSDYDFATRRRSAFLLVTFIGVGSMSRRAGSLRLVTILVPVLHC